MTEIAFSIVQTVCVILSVSFASWQLILNRRILERDSYERLSREYQSLLLQVMTFRHLDNVWEPLSEEDKDRLEAAMTGDTLWGVWYAMSPDEKDCYRYTRAALEIFERAWQLHEARHIDRETWRKWTEWIRTWSRSTYFRYVFTELSPQFVEGFAEWMRSSMVSDPTNYVNQSTEIDGTEISV